MIEIYEECACYADFECGQCRIKYVDGSKEVVDLLAALQQSVDERKFIVKEI